MTRLTSCCLHLSVTSGSNNWYKPWNRENKVKHLDNRHTCIAGQQAHCIAGQQAHCIAFWLYYWSDSVY